MSLKNNRYVTIAKITMINKGPMKVGNGEDGLLIDFASNNPYLPGTSIAGTMRAYALNNFNDRAVKDLFGDGDKESNLYISDSYAKNKKEIEYRPGVRIDNRFGVNEPGGYFERELLGSGHKFDFDIKVYSDKDEKREEYLEILKNVLSAINSGELRFGANKTNGSGIMEITKLDICYLDLNETKDFISYISKDFIFINEKESFLSVINSNKTVRFSFEGNTDTPLLVKGYDSLNSNLPDGCNMINSKNEYIIPGSSFKGAMRNGFNKIAKIKNLSELTEIAFGQDSKSDNKKVGRLYFEDIKIENALDKAIYNRIKIDQFTGGVRIGAILNERPVKGNIKSEIYFRRTGKVELDKKIIATMLFTLRDALIGDIYFGGGSSIGRGKLKGLFIKIDMNNQTAKLDLIGNNHENKDMILDLVSAIN